MARMGNVDGVGSAARFMNNQGYVAAAHTAPIWLVAGGESESIRRAVFTSDVPLRLNVTTVIVTPGKQPYGVVATNDDSTLYAAIGNSPQIVTVLYPLSANTTLGAVLSISATNLHKLTLHPGCESLMLVGCSGDFLLVYNVTSQSTIRSLHSFDSTSGYGQLTMAGTVLPNGTVVFAGYSSSLLGVASWCCLPPYSFSMKAMYTPPVGVTPLPVPAKTRAIIHDTRTGGIFAYHDNDGIRYLSLNPLRSTSVFSYAANGLFLAMVDFIHCSGPVYGILIGYQALYKISFLPLTAGVPPVAGSAIVVAGNGVAATVDGVGSAARFPDIGAVAAAHTAPVWMVGGTSTSIRRLVFTNDVPLCLNVTTLIATPGNQAFGVVFTNDDSKLYGAAYSLQQIATVLNPLSSSPTLGPILSTVANSIHQIALHPGCETILLVGGAGDALLIYNITSQSTIRTLTAIKSVAWTQAGTILTNGTVLFGSSSTNPGAFASWCCLSPYSDSKRTTYTPSVDALSLSVPSKTLRDIIHDTRSGSLFTANDATGIQYLTLSPLSSTVVYSYTGTLFIAMVDFLHCSGSVYGIIVSQQSARKMSFLPLTPGAPPTAGAFIDVAGDGNDGNVDGVGSAARFMNNQGYVAAAHTAPIWLVAGGESESIRRAVFTSDVPLRLNVTTLIVTPGKQPYGVVTTNDDSTLYAAIGNSPHIVTVLYPLSANATLGAVLSISATNLHKLTLHPGCESLMLVGCSGDFLLVYSVTSQSTIRSLHSFDSTSGYGQLTMAGAALPNGTVVFAGYSSSLLGVASWCCLPPYNSTMKATYTPSAGVTPLPVPANKTRDIIHDTRTGGIFASHDEGIRYLTLNPLSSTSIFSYTPTGSQVYLSMVDFIHCSGPVFGILIGYQGLYKMSFLPLTAGVPPVAGSAIVVAGDGTSSNVDGVGSAARFQEVGFIAAAHTAPVWVVGGWTTEFVRRVVFTDDLPLRLNVTTVILTSGKQLLGVVMTNDDSILYASTYNLQQIVTILNPLSSSPDDRPCPLHRGYQHA